jgi:hypothetical protein
MRQSSSNTTRRRGRRVGFAELALATTTPSATSAPRRRIEPHTIPISLIVRDRPLGSADSSLDEEPDSEDDTDGSDELDAEELEPPANGFIGRGGAVLGAVDGPGITGGALGTAPNPPGPIVPPLNFTPHRGQLG